MVAVNHLRVDHPLRLEYERLFEARIRILDANPDMLWSDEITALDKRMGRIEVIIYARSPHARAMRKACARLEKSHNRLLELMAKYGIEMPELDNGEDHDYSLNEQSR